MSDFFGQYFAELDYKIGPQRKEYGFITFTNGEIYGTMDELPDTRYKLAGMYDTNDSAITRISFVKELGTKFSVFFDFKEIGKEITGEHHGRCRLTEPVDIKWWTVDKNGIHIFQQQTIVDDKNVRIKILPINQINPEYVKGLKIEI